MAKVDSAIGRTVAKANRINSSTRVVSSFPSKQTQLDSLVKEQEELRAQRRVINARLKTIKVLLGKQPQPVKIAPVSRPDTAQERYLYVLECDGGRYYIGQTTNIKTRFKKHSIGKGSWFTREYKPVKIVHERHIGLATQSAAAKLEDELTIEWMKKHGIDKVRGGALIQRDTKWFLHLLPK